MDPVMGDLPLPGLPESTNNSNPQLQKVATIDCQNAPNLALKCVEYENTRSLQNTLKVRHRQRRFGQYPKGRRKNALNKKKHMAKKDEAGFKQAAHLVCCFHNAAVF